MSPRLRSQLLAGLAIFLVAGAVAYGVSFHSAPLGAALGLIAALVLLIAFSRIFSFPLLIAAVFAATGMGAGAVALQEKAAADTFVTVERAEEARLHPHADGYVFPKAAYIGRIRGVHRPQDGGPIFVVVPLVDTDWHMAGGQVPVWIGCTNADDYCGFPVIQEGRFLAVPVPEADLTEYRAAAKKIRNRYPIGELDGAPFLRLVEAPQRDSETGGSPLAWAAPLVAFLGWLLVLAVHQRLRKEDSAV